MYVTTNLINDKKYIGEHSTNDLNDNYLGSGKYLKRALKELGKNNFKREILELFESKEEAFYAQEKWIIKLNSMVPFGYNISPCGGYSVSNSYLSEETKKKISNSEKGKIPSRESVEKMRNSIKGRKLSKDHKKKISKSLKGENCYWYGKQLTKSMKIKIKNSLLKRNKNIPLSKETLEKLSKVAKSTIWITNENLKQNKRIKPEFFEMYYKKGFKKGFKKYESIVY